VSGIIHLLVVVAIILIIVGLIRRGTRAVGSRFGGGRNRV
jgi:preprotein translocase subunit SecG